MPPRSGGNLTSPERARRSGIFYGWWIVGVSVLLMATIFGTIINSFSLFIEPVIQDLQGISIAQFTLAYSVITLIAVPFSPIVGNVLKRFDARWVVAVGVGMAAVANVVLSMAQGVWWIYSAAAVQGIAVTFATTIPIATMITNWFAEKRGTALGIATAGSGLGSLIFVPLIQFGLLPALGWRGTYLALGAIQLVLLIPLALLVLRSTPEQKGLAPLGSRVDVVEPAATSTVPSGGTVAAAKVAVRPGLTQSQVYRTPAFWLLGAALIFSGVSVNGMISNLKPLLTALDAEAAIVGFILASLGLFVMVGKFLTGVLFDKMKLMLAIGIVSLANAAQFFFMLSPHSVFNATLFSFLHGFGAPMVTVPLAYLAARLFGERDYSAVYASVSVFAMIGAAVAAPFGAMFYGTATTSDASHATTLVWAWLFMGLIGFALYVATVLVKPKLPETEAADAAAPVDPADTTEPAHTAHTADTADTTENRASGR